LAPLMGISVVMQAVTGSFGFSTGVPERNAHTTLFAYLDGRTGSLLQLSACKMASACDEVLPWRLEIGDRGCYAHQPCSWGKRGS
jgi:hypothetical protein